MFLSTGIIFIFILFVLGYKTYQKKMSIWLLAYFKSIIFKANSKETNAKTRHIIFLFVDHFEAPLGEQMIGQHRINEWIDKYPKIAKRHKDADGKCPQHTWFYAVEKFQINYKVAEEEFRAISKLCNNGYGEIEFHLHHHDDTSESLRKKIQEGIDIFNKFGALITDESQPKKTFGFIHGGWALDNSISKDGQNYCGVNDELKILKELGCYADFTFPAHTHASQPKKINSIYYALDDPDKPKSYDTGVDVEVNKRPSGDLMIIEGPLTIDWFDWRHILYPKVESGDITGGDPPTTHRVDQWIKSNIHIKGRPEWIFVKIYCHGCYDKTMEVVLGSQIDQMFTYLENRYNDGINYKLHYVTARQAYNIIKAAESGERGEPGEFRDYLIKPYRNRIEQTPDK